MGRPSDRGVRPGSSAADVPVAPAAAVRLLEHTAWPVFSLDAQGRYTYFNQAQAALMRDLCGREIEVGAEHAGYFAAGADRATEAHRIARALAGEDVHTHSAPGAAGHPGRVYRTHYGPLRSPDGAVTGVAAVAVEGPEDDCADRYPTGEEEGYRRLAESAPDIIFRYDVEPTMRLSYINPAVYRITGYTAEECYADPHLMINMAHPDDAGLMAGLVQTLAVPGEPTLMRWIGKDGVIRWMESRIVPVTDGEGRLVAVEGITRDVSAGRNAAEALQASEQKYQLLVESSPSSISIVQDGAIVFANARLEALTGSTAEQLRATDPLEVIHPDDRERVRGFLAARSRGEPVPSTYELRIVHADGGTRRLNRSVLCISWEGRDAFMVVDTDITETREAQDSLRRNEERLRVALSVADIAVFAQDRTLRYTWANQPLFGVPVDEVVGRLDSDLLPPAAATAITETKQRVVETATGARMELEVDRSGEIAHYLLMIEPLLAADGSLDGVTGAALDISERRRAESAHHDLEERLHQSQRLEGLGILAGGVAHDFNNLLTVITGTADLALKTVDETDRLHADLSEIKRAGERAAALTRQLLAFSRKQVAAQSIFDLNAHIAGMRTLLQSLLGENTTLVVKAGEGLGGVRADPAQVEQLLMNLVVNARDAMPTGGRVTIETRNVELDRDFVLEHPEAEPGPHVLLAVHDTGVGMDESVSRRAFEPFFTTKAPGKGTGLGLATVYGIVKQSEGTIWMNTAPGRGTSFLIYLPRVAPAPDSGIGAPPAPPVEGTETVLVVDDEKALRELVSRIVTANGYQVLVAADGPEALALLENEETPVHLLLTDVILPGLNGPELASRSARIRPHLKVMFMSGYTEDTVLHQGVRTARTHFIAKPYAPNDLVAKVREALDAPGPSREGPGDQDQDQDQDRARTP